MLRTQLNDALKVAMKAKRPIEVSTLRLILAALKDRDIAAREHGNTDGIGDPEILEMLQKMVRQRHDSIEMYRKGDRPDLVEQEQAEITVIARFLPQTMTEAETKAAVEGLIEELGANTIKDMGKVMGALKKRYPGRMDFGKASALVKAGLA